MNASQKDNSVSIILFLTGSFLMAIGVITSLYPLRSLKLTKVWLTTLQNIYSVPLLGGITYTIYNNPIVDLFLGSILLIIGLGIYTRGRFPLGMVGNAETPSGVSQGAVSEESKEKESSQQNRIGKK